MKPQDNPSATNKPSQEVQRRGTASPLNPWEEMDKYFENVFPRAMMRFGRWPWPEWSPAIESKLPAVDVIDRAEDILVRAEVPGVKKEDLDISVRDNLVTIRGTTRREEERKDEQYYRRETMRGEYSRTVTLPAEVDNAKARASFKDGVLELTLPKTAPSQRRTIKVE